MNWVKTILVEDGAANSDRGIWEGKGAVTICAAQYRAIIKFTELLPSDEVVIGVELSLLCRSAELVLLSKELVRSEDGEDTENENDKEEYAHQARDGFKESSNLSLHHGHLVDGAKGSENTEGS